MLISNVVRILCRSKPEDGPVLSPKSSVTLIIITLIHQLMNKVSEVKVR
jgi:hypothetical protein